MRNPLTAQEKKQLKNWANTQYAISARFADEDPVKSSFYRGRSVAAGKVARQYNPKKVYRTVATFPSKSKPDKYYEVKIDGQGNLSCNCPAWVFKKGSARTCTHVKAVESGMRNPTNLYESFHGSPPKGLRKVNLPVPPKGSKLVMIGRLSALEYIPEKPSKLANTIYRHKLGDTGSMIMKEKPILATDAAGKNLFIIPDKSSPKMTERGIVG